MAAGGTRRGGEGVGGGPDGGGSRGERTRSDTRADEVGIDEIGVVLGPDEPVGGLFERTGTDTTGTATSRVEDSRDASGGAPIAAPPLATGEATSTDIAGPETTSGRVAGARSPVLPRSGPRRRTALLAWIAADLPTLHPAPGASDHGGEPGSATPPSVRDPEATEATRLRDGGTSLSAVAALARVIAEESLDPLPALDGWLFRGRAPEPPPEALPDTPPPADASLPAIDVAPVADPFSNRLTTVILLLVLALAYFFPG